MKYVFQRIDVHYVTIEAGSLVEAQEIADNTPVTNDGVELEAGHWAPTTEE